MHPRWIRLAVAMAIALAVSAGIAWWQVDAALRQRARPVSAGSSESIGGPFALVDQTGAPVTEESWPGRHLLIYFGYAFCPDVCPTELARMAAAIDLLGEEGGAVQPIFITVDPARDTPEVLAGYVPLFHPRLVGLTGSAEQVAEAARVFRVYYAKAEGGGTTDYLMEHMSFIYLMGPDGANEEIFRPGTSAEDLAAVIARHLGGA
jgi:protein SCO1/2